MHKKIMAGIAALTILVACSMVAAPAKTPVLTSLSVTSFISGQTYTVNAYGSGFTNKSVVYFNDQPCPTVFVSPSQLQFTIVPAQLVGLIGSYQIYVFNPSK